MVLALFAAGLGFASLPAGADSNASPAPSSAAGPTVVHISEFKYKPTPLTVHVGDTVKFVNDDSVAHTVTAKDKSFDSGNMDQNKSWTYTFSKAGEYDYFCTYHTFMVSKVVVKPADSQ